MRKKLAVVLGGIFLLSSAGCTKWGKPVPGWTGATGGENLERQFWQDVKEKKYAEIERRLAPTFTLVTADGFRNREQTLEYLKQLALEDYSLGEVKVHPNGHDMVVTYTLLLRGTRKGQALENAPLNVATVWQETTNTWVAISQSAVPSGNPLQASPAH
ncbi:MAG TPA: nuclear transport factor 2 family protein [Terriglobales bacterium]|nr:nuclear transport factor 2 family protein [Terriglobales bacterium]